MAIKKIDRREIKDHDPKIPEPIFMAGKPNLLPFYQFFDPATQRITKVMCINATLDAPLTVAGETLECVDSFTYLGSGISKDGGAQKDIKNILSKARNAFASL